MLDNPYSILELRDGATPAEAKRAFRRLAMAWHPDRNPSREAEERFKRIRLAYELILDPERIAQWTAERGAPHADADAPGEAREDETDAPQETRPADHVLNLSLEQAAFGCEHTIVLPHAEHCDDCAGSGRVEYVRSVACADCGGCGRLRNGRHGTHICNACAGRGYVRVAPCPACAGSGHLPGERRLRVRIPAGIRCGEQVRVRGQKRKHGQPADDLLIEIALDPHPLFDLDGDDLLCTVPASVLALLAGTEIEIPTLAGTQRTAFAHFTGAPAEHRLRGLGFPKRHGRGAGDLRVTLQPVFPQALDADTRQHLSRLDASISTQRKCWPSEFHRWHSGLDRRRRNGNGGAA